MALEQSFWSHMSSTSGMLIPWIILKTMLMMKASERSYGAKPFACPSHYTNRTRMSKKERSIVLSHRYIGVYPLQGSIPTIALGKFSQKKRKVKWPLKFTCNISLVRKAWAKTITRLIFKRIVESWDKSSTPTLITPTLIYWSIIIKMIYITTTY